jgi:hypothetical protein
MKIAGTNLTVKAGNWTIKTPGRIKFICDLLLFISLVITSLWPEVDIALKIGVAIKLLSNFIAEHIPVPPVEAVNPDEQV